MVKNRIRRPFVLNASLTSTIVTKPESVHLGDFILKIFLFLYACITSMRINELILAGHCVCWWLAHHNREVSCWLGVLLKCLHTLSLYAHNVSFAADTGAVGEGSLPHSLHLFRPARACNPGRLNRKVPCMLWSCCFVIHALLLQGAFPQILHHLAKLHYF